MKMTLRYGRQGLEVELPDDNVLHVLHLREVPTLRDPAAAAQQACDDPLGTPPLQELAKGGKSACVVISDITRPVPNRVLVPPILRALHAAGLDRERILILVATGLHRAATEAELHEMLGEEIMAGGYQVESHLARDQASHVHLGRTSQGTEVWVDRRYVESDVRILVSLVEPHVFAGYSGGRKTICPGISAAQTIMGFHSPAIIEAPRAIAGNIYDNVCDREAHEVAALAGRADFTMNCTLNEERELTGIFAGDFFAAPLAAMELAERQSKVVIQQPVDIVVTTNAGYPLDLTFYQCAKGISAAVPIVKPGGAIIIAQENAEGIGNAEFTELMLQVRDPHEFVQQALRTGENQIDQWGVHQLEKMLRRCKVYSYSDGIPADVQSELFMKPVSSVEEGVQRALAEHGSAATIAVIPEGPYVMPCLSSDPLGQMNVRQMAEKAANDLC